MRDPRFQKLSHTLVHHSTRLKAGDKILIEATCVPVEMLEALMEEVQAVGAIPIVATKSPVLNRRFLLGGTLEELEARLRLQAEIELFRMKQMDAYVSLRGADNITELSDVPQERMKLFNTIFQATVHSEQRVKHTRWVVLRWPNPAMAQQANMSTQAFEDYYFNVCLTDYAFMEKAVQPLLKRMKEADKVRVTGPDTDISFSIKGIGAVSCHGLRNIPDGECYSAPVRDSVNGVIHFNTPTLYMGIPMEDIRLVFRDGKVVECSSSNTEALNMILDTDEGARYLGEFAIGFNPNVTKPMRDTLFDEKIRGSIHMALGHCYDAAPNGNVSANHWDNVLIQEGGGDIYFDGELIRHDGLFVTEDLLGLNPDSFPKG